MKENPYYEFLNIMSSTAKNNQSPTIQIGTIVTPPPNIQVSYKNILLESAELYISEYLLVDYERTTKGHMVSETQPRSGGGGDPAFASHTHDIDNDYTENIITTDTLKAGDKVAIMPCQSEDGTSQQYIILDKIVRPDRRSF